MPVRPVRRLDLPSESSLYEEMASQALHALYFRRDIEAVEREHPELILTAGENVLLAHPGGYTAKLAYSFESDRMFTELFPPMLEKLLPRVRKALRADTVRFRLTHAPSRPLVEPVLKRLYFAPRRDWLRFDIDRGDASKPAALAGVKFRAGTPDDAEAIAEIDRASFPDTPLPLAAMRMELTNGEREFLVALRGKRMVGYCSFALPDSGFGYIHDIAVAPDERGRGIGGALTLRALKRLFGDGAESAALTTDDANSNAIRLYRALGFRQTEAGRDYERPADPKAIAKIAKQTQGTLVKFGGWR
ncbi:MAG TPA: GNAT family N-acetyltransferase [Dehalococcoidia bacterium]|nr:GNAT family N-acetyltransferase [Dehalococcoidia bacterium]